MSNKTSSSAPRLFEEAKLQRRDVTDREKLSPFEKIRVQCESVSGTKDGVKVQKTEFRLTNGTGSTIKEILFENQEKLKDLNTYLSKNEDDFQLDSIFVHLTYSAFLSDNLNEPFDYTGYQELSNNKYTEIEIGKRSTGPPGLEIAVLELSEGDSAYIVCDPDYAYGKLGCPPRIPANSVVVYNVKIEKILTKFIEAYVDLTYNERRLIPMNYVLDQIKGIDDFPLKLTAIQLVVPHNSDEESAYNLAAFKIYFEELEKLVKTRITKNLKAISSQAIIFFNSMKEEDKKTYSNQKQKAETISKGATKF